MANFYSTIQNKQILFAALDWGMGHLTRSTVILKNLLENGNTIHFAGTKKQCDFIQAEFDLIECFKIGGYEMNWDSNKNPFTQVLVQFPKIKKAIRKEQQWLQRFVANHPIDLIISDNRYGFYQEKIQSVLITHQLNLQIPHFKSLVNHKLHQWISKFSLIWVPDFEDRRLTGELSNPQKLKNVHFIGPLCRFERMETAIIYDYLIILSGPEPERTNFIQTAFAHCKAESNKIGIVGAKVEGIDSFENPTTHQLGQLIAKSDTIISRAGYTSIMELVYLDKKAILFPTKGQYEQEYLAKQILVEQLEFNWL